MGRWEQRRERNKKLIADINNLIFDCYQVRENDLQSGMPDDEDHQEAFYNYFQSRLQAMLLDKGWTWIDFITILNFIRNKMIDFGKLQEFEELYNEYKPKDEVVTNYSYGNWDFLCIFMFGSHLLIDFSETIHKIADGLIKDSENG